MAVRLTSVPLAAAASAPGALRGQARPASADCAAIDADGERLIDDELNQSTIGAGIALDDAL